LLAVFAALVFYLRGASAREVTLVQPVATAITETITTSGRVGGETETLVGAQFSGVVRQLFVKEGDLVKSGQTLAILNNDVARAQIAQARQAVITARAQLAEVISGSRPTDIRAAAEQVQQARAQVAQQQAALNQAEQAVAQSQAQLRQTQSEQQLAERNYRRTLQLFESGVVSAADFDQARSNLEVARQRVASAREGVRVAESNVQAAAAAVRAAEANVRTLEARRQGVRQGPTPEEVQVARQRVAEAEQALRVAEEQAANAVVTAPFDGIVTEITAEVGQTVTNAGVLRLVSSRLEISVDVDENNLADLSVGQEAIISSSAFVETSFKGTVSELGAAVDPARGVVTVKITPVSPPDWLRPGQTVNVNIVTGRAVERLVIPPSALSSVGDRTVVFVVEDGTAVEKSVVTRPPTSAGVPVLAGLSSDDRIIADAQGISPGDQVRVKQ
jgi:HlyD family secretion protein